MGHAQQPDPKARWNDSLSHTLDPKPLLRGWLHAVAAVGAVAATLGLIIETYHQPRGLVAILIFGLSMIVLYTVSALYHLGRWHGLPAIMLHALDRANIFLLIAGTYTPFCLLLLDGILPVTVLTLIWILAIIGIGSAIITMRSARWLSTMLYLGMGWLSVIMLPVLLRALPLAAIAVLIGGGIFYSVGAVIYALQRPNPWPAVFGFHEIFHLLVVAGSGAFLLVVWGWVVPLVSAPPAIFPG
ncbi:MAG: hemolysin III family protein [Chloroflexota bacterium]|nr:hemolysin III family protein [Chloroflexota bacterium]